MNKKEEFNQKRIESLRLQSLEFKAKKNQIRNDLKKLDKEGAASNRKIIFDNDDEEGDKNEPIISKRNSEFLEEPKVATKSKQKEIKSENEKAKKFKLIESDEDEESANTEKENTFRLLESKINLDEDKANKLIYLKSKFSNDDARFKINERFVESSSSDSSEGESDDEDEERDANKAADDEDEEKKPSIEPNQKKLEKKLRKEKEEQFKILESITGKPIMQKKTTNEKNSKSKVSQMVRYDPTKEDHKMFEILSEDEEEKILKPNVAEKSEEKPASDPSKFTQVESNLKDLFCSKDIFKFKFEHLNEELSEKNETETFKSSENKFQKGVMAKFNAPVKNVWSSESEDEHEDEHYDDNDEEEKYESDLAANLVDDERDIVDREDDYEEKETSSQLKEQRIPARKPITFLPDTDSQIKEGLKFFIRTKQLDELRREWKEKRDSIVQEYQKKHKRMMRIKRTKENEKLLPWKFKKNSNKK